MAEQGGSWDVLVVGSGIAGLRGALRLAEHWRVLLVTKKRISESNTNYAQGGISAVLGGDDGFELHTADTLQAGAGLCRAEVVRRVVAAGPEMIADLIRQGIHFSEEESGGLSLGREGGHSRRRIVHAGDFTGKEVEAALVERARAHASITMLEDHLAMDLVQDEAGRVWGAHVLDCDTGRLATFPARMTLLATGGCGKVYRYTSNPDIATGDGIAMAYRAGATVGNLEFVQFHPTCLFHPQARNFLISEAVRGEGAILRNLDGEAFMARYHERRDLAPRDIVARAIDQEMKGRGEDHVLLDTTVLDPDSIPQRFPNISARCLQYGLDMRRDPLPVVPAAHYMCGGVVVDEQGASDLPGLFVIGEASCTGVHGANRLASNSLLEAVYYAHAAAHRIDQLLREERRAIPSRLPAAQRGQEPLLRTALRHDWNVARKTMWDYVGIVRDLERLETARHRMEQLAQDAEAFTRAHLPDADLLELRNVTLLGSLIVRCALFRRESRGLHHMVEYPRPDDERFRGETHLRRGEEPWLCALLEEEP